MSTSTDTISDRDRAEQLLTERGVDGAKGLIADYSDENLPAVFGAIAWFDDGQQSYGNKPSTGLLVKKIKDGGLAGYRRPHERSSVEGVAGASTDDLMHRIRGMALSYSLSSSNVVRSMSREELKRLISKTAHRLGTTPDALIDSAVAPEWTWTPPHPAVLTRDGESKTAALARYSVHVASGRADRHPNPSRVRLDGESLWDYACRFWDYQLPADAVSKAEQLAAKAAEQRKADAEAHAADLEQRQRQLGLTEQHVEADPADEPAPVQENLERAADAPTQPAPDLDQDPGPEEHFDPVSGRVTRAGTPYGHAPARKSEAEWEAEAEAPRTTKESFLGSDDDVTAQDLAAADRAEREKADASTDAPTNVPTDEDDDW